MGSQKGSPPEKGPSFCAGSEHKCSKCISKSKAFPTTHTYTYIYIYTNGCGSKPMMHFGMGAPPILVYFSGWIGMFTGGTIWILPHGHMYCPTLYLVLMLTRQGRLRPSQSRLPGFKVPMARFSSRCWEHVSHNQDPVHVKD